jgi:hypothetical protein
VLKLLLFLVKLPFVLLGAVASLLAGVVSLVLGIVGWLASGLWTLLVSVLVALLVVWVLIALLRRRRARMA